MLSVAVHALLFWPQTLLEATGNAAVARLHARLHSSAITPPRMTPVAVTDALPIRAPRPPAAQAIPVDPVATSARMQASPGLDAAGVRAYRIALARVPGLAAASFGELPSAELEIGIAVDTAEVGLILGSGDAALDAKVLDAVRMAVREASVPFTLRGTGAVVPVRIRTGE